MPRRSPPSRSGGRAARTAAPPKTASAVSAVGAVPAVPRTAGARRGAVIAVHLLLAALCLLVVPSAHDAFDLPKRLAAEVLALVSLVLLAWGAAPAEPAPGGEPAGPVGPMGRLRDAWSRPAVRMVTPLLAVATLSLAWSDHPRATGDALVSLWIGAAALVGWSLGLPAARLRRLLTAVAGWAGLAALLSVLQALGVYRPLLYMGGEEAGRLGTGALVGNPGVLAGWLALASVIAWADLRRAWGTRRGLLPGLLLVLLWAALLGTRVLAGLAAALAGAVVYWALTLPRKRALAAGAALLIAGGALLALAPPLSQRVAGLRRAAASGDLNQVLSGRLDGWRTAAHMAAEHPLTGVGHGGYASGFADAKLALAAEGTVFFEDQATVMFGNAHDEILEVAAETGLLGLAALGFALWVLARVTGRLPVPERALAWAVLTVLLLLALAHFPFRVAATAYPAVLALAWLLAAAEAAS
jgi:O-antigen ligase